MVFCCRFTFLSPLYFFLPLYCHFTFLSPLYCIFAALYFHRRFTLSPHYFILAASVFLSPQFFCGYLNSRGNIKQRRKKTGDKIIKERQKNMQQLGMALLGFRNIYINELFSERDMNKNLIKYGLRELLTLAA